MSLADPDLVTLPSAHGVTETVERLKALLAQKGIEVFAHIDHAAGAQAFRRDNPNAVVQLLDTGHFALETHVEDIAVAVERFLAQTSR